MNLRDDAPAPDNTLTYVGLAALGIAALWMTGFFYTLNTTIKTAPKLGKLIPFL